MESVPLDAALLLIDVQEGIDHPANGRRNNPHAEENMTRLLAAWRGSGRPIIHIQHLSTRPESALRPGQPGVEIKESVRPQEDEPVIQKHANSAFIGTNLEDRLRQGRIETLIITGLTTDHCVSATARTAGDLGFRTYVVDDATATFGRLAPAGVRYSPEDVHAVSLATLEGEFATVVDTGSILRAMGENGAVSVDG